MKEKQTGKGFIVAIIILVGIIIGLGVYIYFTDFYNKDSISKTNNEIKEENNKVSSNDEFQNLDTTSGEAVELFRDIGFNYAYPGSSYALYDRYFSDKKITRDDLDSDSVALIALNNIYKDKVASGEENVFSNVGDAFTSEELHNQFSKYFGSDYQYTDKSFTKTCPTFEYDETNKKYVITQAPECGGTSGPSDIIIISKAEKNSKELDIYVRILFVGDDGYSYYYDYLKTQKSSYDVTRILYGLNEEIQKGSLYKMTFVKDNGNYVFSSSEPVK